MLEYIELYFIAIDMIVDNCTSYYFTIWLLIKLGICLNIYLSLVYHNLCVSDLALVH